MAKKRSSRPALTVEGRENQMIALAIDLAEQQLRDGTATSQVITHYLKLGTTMAQLEKEKLAQEVQLAKAKTEQIESNKRVEELYSNALNAMRMYAGAEERDCNDERDI